MQIPKVIFRYSWIYDQHFKDIYKKNYPSFSKVTNYIKPISYMWSKNEKNILTELSKITKLNWHEKEILCYVVGRAIPFSDPLTVPIYNNKEEFIDTLTHELIHKIFSQGNNLKLSESAWAYINRKYKSETSNTRIHIPLQAIHNHLILKFFSGKRLNREISTVQHLLEYRKAWNIVKKEGYDSIIKEFTKRII